MMNLPDTLYTAAQTRQLDSIASEQFGLSGSELMARAGAATLALIQQRWPTAKQLLIIAGTGNNGGDGFELARQAHQQGDFNITIIQVGQDDNLSPTADQAKQAMVTAGLTTQHYNAEDTLPDADLIIDALFGTGLNRELDQKRIDLINTLNQTGIPILALDIPSGLHADTGTSLGAAINACATLSFIGLNIGLFTGHSPEYSGKVDFHDLGVPAATYENITPIAIKTTLQQYNAFLKPRNKASHKGHYGHVLVIGGQQGFSGAARMAAEASARTGAGLTSIATDPAHADTLNTGRPELMCHGVENAESLKPLLKSVNTLVIGPGLGQSDWSYDLLEACLDSPLPKVIDADALNLLAVNPSHHDNWVLTPHPGEAARLLNCSTTEIQADRINAIKQLHQRYGGVIILKGAGTLIYDGKQLQLCADGNPGMATGGMGDILAGIIGGLIAQKLTLMDAACLAVTLHGLAGDKAAQHDGERGMLAMDLLPHIRHLLNPSR